MRTIVIQLDDESSAKFDQALALVQLQGILGGGKAAVVTQEDFMSFAINRAVNDILKTQGTG